MSPYKVPLFLFKQLPGNDRLTWLRGLVGTHETHNLLIAPQIKITCE